MRDLLEDYPLANSIDPEPPFNGPRLPWTIRFPSRRPAYLLAAAARAGAPWICRKCGTRNDPDRAGCSSCARALDGYTSLPRRPW